VNEVQQEMVDELQRRRFEFGQRVDGVTGLVERVEKADDQRGVGFHLAVLRVISVITPSVPENRRKSVTGRTSRPCRAPG